METKEKTKLYCSKCGVTIKYNLIEHWVLAHPNELRNSGFNSEYLVKEEAEDEDKDSQDE